MTLRIEQLSGETHDAWDEFVNACPEATFFHRAGWQQVIQKTFRHPTHFLAAKRGTEIEGILPLVHVKSRLFGNALISNAFCVAGGPACLSDSARDLLVAEAQKMLEESGADYLEFRSDTGSAEGWVRKDDLYANFERPIESDEDANLKQIPRKQRAVVRKALKDESMVSKIDDTTDRIFDLYALNVRNHGTPVFSRKYFKALKECFGDDCEILTISSENRALSSVLSFYFRDRVLPYYTGGVAEARKRGANDLMYWAVMRRALERGYSVFDFGRSKRETGPFSFKKNWGFDPQPISHSFFLKPGQELPNINPLNPKYRLFINIWQRLPLPVANMIGPHIVRNIG